MNFGVRGLVETTDGNIKLELADDGVFSNKASRGLADFSGEGVFSKKDIKKFDNGDCFGVRGSTFANACALLAS